MVKPLSQGHDKEQICGQTQILWIPEHMFSTTAP